MAILPGELFTENSRAHAERSAMVFALSAKATLPSTMLNACLPTKASAPPGSVAPGYLVKRPVGGRADVLAVSRYEHGRWMVTLRRALQTGDPHDVVFVPGDEMGVAFGLALMDHSPFEHYASNTVERLVLLKQ